MEFILLIILAVVLVLCVIVAVVSLHSKRKRYFRKDIHISGGADIDTGQLTSDNNYFKGFTDGLEKTVVIGNNYKNNSVMKVTLRDIGKSSSMSVNICNSLILGRGVDSGIYTVSGDNMISKRHCELLANTGKLYLRDLDSANHTFLNGEQVITPVLCKSGDVIKIGNTKLELIF